MENAENKLDIIHEDDDFLVVNKPAGLITHGAKQIKEETLADILLAARPQIKNVGEDASRPGIMHRLDRQASGLMVIAKNQKSFDHLKNKFKNREVVKRYTALVHGKIARDDGEIIFPIARSARGYRMAAQPLTSRGEKNDSGREAHTAFSVIKRFVNHTLLSVKIKTGRTHQIRVHLSAYGHAIVGDDIYGTKKNREKNKKLGLNRLFLIADELEFTGLDKKIKKFNIELPEDLKLLLEKIK